MIDWSIRFAAGRRDHWLRAEIERSGYEYSPEVAALDNFIMQAVATHEHPRTAARILGNRLRPLGVSVDTERLVRTELAMIECGAAWFASKERESWTPESVVFRVPSTSCCDQCLRLAFASDGMPRLYRVGELQKPGAFRPNVGPRRRWVQKVGPVHANCCCAPWQLWSPRMDWIFRPKAPIRALRLAEIRQLPDAPKAAP